MGVKEELNKIEFRAPLIHCLTNYVTVNDVANLLVSIGASPIMAHHREEIEGITSRADCLLINLGATEYYEEIERSAQVASKVRIPIVLDPVGTAASSFRRRFAERLLKSCKISYIRGNISEVRALILDKDTAKGVDADKKDESDEEGLFHISNLVKEYSRKTDIVISVSGKADIITDGREVFFVKGGDPMIKRMSGSGCMSSALLSCFASVKNGIIPALMASKMMRVCANRAKKQNDKMGSASFKLELLNRLSLFIDEEMQDNIEVIKLD